MGEFKTVSLADQVFEQLEDDIITGKYPRGELLTELKLVEQLGVSRTPIREALRRLEQENLIRDSGKGSVVLGIAQEDEQSGPLTLNLAIMKLTETGFTAKFDVRFPLCANEDNCKRTCEASFAAHGISVTGDPDMTTVHCVEADSPLVRTLLSCYSTYTGVKDPKPIAIGGGTYVHEIPGGVAFGCTMPGFDTHLHGADERVKIADLMLSAKLFAHIILDMCAE